MPAYNKGAAAEQHRAIHEELKLGKTVYTNFRLQSSPYIECHALFLPGVILETAEGAAYIFRQRVYRYNLRKGRVYPPSDYDAAHDATF